MSQSSHPGLRSISFLDDRDFLQHDPAHGRLDKAFDSDVTVSAIPDGENGMRWEARTRDGQALRVFRMTITRPTTIDAPDVVAFSPTFVDAGETGCFICYEDHIRMQSICVRAPC